MHSCGISYEGMWSYGKPKSKYFTIHLRALETILWPQVYVILDRTAYLDVLPSSEIMLSLLCRSGCEYETGMQ